MLGILNLFELGYEVIPRLVSEVFVLRPLKPLIMLILDMLNDKFCRSEGLLADCTSVFLSLRDLFCLVKAILSLHFDEEGIL